MLWGQVQFVSVQLSPCYDQWLGATAELLPCALLSKVLLALLLWHLLWPEALVTYHMVHQQLVLI